jgi:enoyl-CoA hydratase/carnithine racemase
MALWTGDPISSDQALAWGLADQVAPDGAALEEAVALARRFAEGPSLSIATIKRAVYKGLERDLLSHAEYEQFSQDLLRNTEDAREGRLSFQEGRPARFTGR